jgi:hypothetical protein
MKKLLAVAVIVCAAAGLARADIYIKSKTHSDPVSIMGQNQPARDAVTEQWMGDDAFATVSQGTTVLVDFKRNTFAMINHAKKTYVETALPLDMTKLLPPQVASMMGSMMKSSVSVTPTGQSRQIGQWACTGYEATITMMGMPMKETIWATKDTGVDMQRYMATAFGTVLKSQMFFDDAAVGEFKKIDGFPVLTEVNAEMMGAKVHSTTEVVEIAKKTPPAGVYAIPAGYAKVDTLSMEDLQKR